MELDTTIMDIARARHKQIVPSQSLDFTTTTSQLTHVAPTHSFYIDKEGSSLDSKRVEDSIVLSKNNRVFPLVAKRWRYCLSHSLV